MADHVYIARQPIVAADRTIHGYELLFRALQEDGSVQVNFGDEMIATTRVVVNTLNHIGVQDVVGDSLAFVNIDEELLMDDIVLSFPKERFVIELLEHIIVTDKIVERIAELKALGYKIALDDVHFDAGYMENFKPIFPYLEILKLDVSLIDKELLEEHIDELKALDCQLLAEKVETKEDFEYFKNLGCQLFQGYFFAKPDIIKKKALDPAYKKIFKLINLLDKDTDIQTISTTFEESPEVTVQLLRFMNSGSLGLRSNIRSIAHAISLLGKRPLKQWLLLIAFSKSGNQRGDTLNSPLIELAQARAKLMAELMKRFAPDSDVHHEAALVGVLSLIDVITGTSMETVLRELDVDDDIENALLKCQGELGTLLELSKSVEAFDIEKANFLLSNLNLSQTTLEAAILASYKKGKF
jgi:EAL and modified HD-GYP domain-containing signal transduction protein